MTKELWEMIKCHIDPDGLEKIEKQYPEFREEARLLRMRRIGMKVADANK